MRHGYVGFRGIMAAVAAFGLFSTLSVQAAEPINDPPAFNDDLDLEGASATLDSGSTIIFEQTVKGSASGTAITPFGTLEGAAVLGHVFPTTLNSSDIGFDSDQGLVALAITWHPDFDDTPLADENNNNDPHDDGDEIHSHWVVLTTDVQTSHNNGVEDVVVNLAVKPLDFGDPSVTRPVTHPGADFPLYIDSPNFFVTAEDEKIAVHVPTEAVNNRTDFQFDAVTAFLEVHPNDPNPLLGVYVVYDVLSGDLSLPFNVVPEPGSAVIFGLGLVGIGSRLCRRRTLKV